MHAHCDCSMSSFRRSTFSDRIARSSLLAFIALWNSALPTDASISTSPQVHLTSLPLLGRLNAVWGLAEEVRAH